LGLLITKNQIETTFISSSSSSVLPSWI